VDECVVSVSVDECVVSVSVDECVVSAERCTRGKLLSR